MGYEGAIQSVTFLSLILFLLVGARQVLDGGLTIGGLVAFNSLVALANGPLGALLGLWDNYQLSSVLVDRLNDILENEPEQGHDHSQLTPVRSLEGRVTLRDVGFRYGGPESPARWSRRWATTPPPAPTPSPWPAEPASPPSP